MDLTKRRERERESLARGAKSHRAPARRRVSEIMPRLPPPNLSRRPPGGAISFSLQLARALYVSLKYVTLAWRRRFLSLARSLSKSARKPKAASVFRAPPGYIRVRACLRARLTCARPRPPSTHFLPSPLPAPVDFFFPATRDNVCR